MNYSIYLKNIPNQKGTYPIYLRVFQDRKSKYLSLGISVKESDWNKDKRIVKRSDILYVKKNAIIKAYTQKADNILLSYIIDDKPFSLDSFIKKLKNKNLIDFYKFSNKLILEKKKVVTNKTCKGYHSSLVNLRLFRSELMLSSIDESFLTQFRNFMIKNGKSPGTQSVYISFISMVLKEAVKEQLISYNPCLDFKIDYKQVEQPYLTSNEVLFLEELAGSNKLKRRVSNTLKLFLFSCYTGISYTDLKKLTNSSIESIFVDGVEYLMIQGYRQKTKSSFRVPLTKDALKIINNYNSYTKYLFIPENSSTTSAHMKKIREACPEIKKHFTFHTARHSFGTYWISQGAPERVVMEMMGHTEAKTNRIYSKVQDFTLIEAVLKNPRK